MAQQAGLWIDHKEAFIVFIDDGKDDATESTHVPSNMESHVRYTGHSASDGSAEDQRDRQFATHLDQYYDNVLTHLKDASKIFIFGPGEAKGEFNKRLDHKGWSDRADGVETVDKMTERQIEAKVREHYKKP